MQLYGIPNCDKVRGARKWLQEHDIAYDFVDLRNPAPAIDLIQEWLHQVGDEQLVNRRSTTWRGLSPQQREAHSPRAWAELLRANPALIKRPLAQVSADRLLCGFAEDVYQREFL